MGMAAAAAGGEIDSEPDDAADERDARTEEKSNASPAGPTKGPEKRSAALLCSNVSHLFGMRAYL